MLEFKQKLKKEFMQKLNREQQQAVSHFTGPLLVYAGAGSGKTRVITHRIAYLIRILDVPAEKIVAVTFTNKAADEMKERVHKLIGPYGDKVVIKTFHSLGLQIIRENYHHLGLKSNFSIYDSSSQKTLAKKILKELQLDTSALSVSEVLHKIHLARDEFLSPDEFYSRFMENSEIDVLYMFYKKYIEQLRMNNAVDFGDLLYESVRLFREKKFILELYQNRWEFFMIDEYQDTNYVQYLLSMLITKKKKNIMVVGDDDQSIYSWRGAKIENIWNFQKDFPDAKIIKLEENYRSTNAILNLANRLIQYNTNRASKKLFSKQKEGEKPILIECESEYQEANEVVNTIMKLSSIYPYSEMAIFYRTNAQSRVFEQVLRENQIPYVIYGGIRFFERKEIKDILGYLQFLLNPYDFESLERMLENPPKGIGKKTIENIKEIAMIKQVHYYDALRILIEEKKIRNVKKLKDFFDRLSRWKQEKENNNIANLISMIIRDSGIIEFYEKKSDPENLSRIENIKEFIQSVIEYEEQKKRNHQKVSLSEYLQDIALWTSEDMVSSFNKKDGMEGVRLMTFHNAKGLEFSVVFITGLEEGILPHRFSMEEENIEEERRLLYVGVTRAKEKLYLTYSKFRSRYGYKEPTQPSSFLKEMELLSDSVADFRANR